MVTIKLTSTNYLLWKNQMVSILDCQDMLYFVDGYKTPPPPQILDNSNKEVPNPVYTSWHSNDQRLQTLLLSSLIEESMAQFLGCTYSHVIWLALESAFSQSSKSHELRLKDDIQLMKKGPRSITEYGNNFKSLCEQ